MRIKGGKDEPAFFVFLYSQASVLHDYGTGRNAFVCVFCKKEHQSALNTTLKSYHASIVHILKREDPMYIEAKAEVTVKKLIHIARNDMLFGHAL